MTFEGTIDERFRRTVRWYPDDVAFRQVDSDLAYTYAEANERMCRFANALRDRGIEKGDRVAFLAHTIVDQAVAFLACQKIGALPAAIHAREAPAVMEEMIADIDPAAFVFQPQFERVARTVADDVDSIDLLVAYDHDADAPEFASGFAALVADGSPSQPDVTVEPEDRAFINFSSGTTSHPKPVVHTQGNAVRAIHLGHYHYDARDYDVGLLFFGPSFIGWVNQILTWTSAGACALCMERFDPVQAVELIDEHDVTSLLMVPVHLRQLLAAGLEECDGDSVRVFGYAGEPVEAETVERVIELFPDAVYTAYGSTEVMTSIVHCSTGHLDPEKPRAVGRPLPGVDARIIEPGSRDPTAELARGEAGELIVSGPSVAEEIWDAPELTERLFHEDGWWFSGDLARIGDDGMLYLEGRTDNMIVSGGINIQAEAVEAVLRRHGGVVDCGVVGTPSDEWGEVVTAYVVGDGELTAEELDEWCRENEHLADYQRPRRYVFIEDLPKTDSGKLSRQALEERARQDADADRQK